MNSQHHLPDRVIRGLLGLLGTVAFIATSAPAVAQEPPDTTKTRAELIRERLRNARPVILDSAQIVADSVLADSIARARELASRRGAPLPHDSTMMQLLRLPGYMVTEYKADSARFASDSSRLRLNRQAQVVREGQTIVADSTIVFDQGTSIACAKGSPTVSGAGESPLRADSLCYNVDTRRGQAYSVLTEITEGANWIVRSDESFVVGDTLYSHTGIFTDCNLEEPHYHFGAGELKYINRDIIVARDVTLNFRDVPVFWLPFFVQSTKQGRRSGILTPRFGVNDLARTSTGYNRRIENVGLFWAMSDYMGAELALDWQSQNFTSLRGTLNYRFLRQFLAGSVTYRNYWQAGGGTQFTLATQTNWQPDERTQLNGNVSYATSTRFIRDRSLDPRELNQSIDSNVGVRRRFDWGNISLSGQRQQYITDNTVNMTLPSLNLTLNSITLFEAQPGEESWYSNATWTGSGSSTYRTKSVDDTNASAAARGGSELNTTVSSSFTLGRLGVSQGMTYNNSVMDERLFPNDTTLDPLSRSELTRINWNAGVSFQQRLMGTTTLTPGLSMSGELLESDTIQRVSSPTRIDFSAALRTDLFGFFPGIGPLERIRHRISPSINYTYSPAPTVTPLQERVFGLVNVRERNRLSIGISQTFEGKPRVSAEDTAQAGRQGIGQLGPAPGDSLAAQDTLSGLSSTEPGGPRRQQRVQPITLLSINTDAVVYDWVQAREGIGGVQTAEIGNNIQSDLLRGLQISFAHDLFEEHTDSVTRQVVSRDFAPHLSRLTMSFSVDADSWIARMIGLGRSEEDSRQAQQQMQQEAAQDTGRVPPQVEDTGSQFGLLGNANERMAPRMPTGTWRASLNYTMRRPRDATFGSEDQMLTASVALQPTPQWSLNWNTGYSFTRGEFTDHILTLTRALHDWDANFDFVKAQNGNFSFQFRVQLRANPEFKIDYDQRDIRGVQEPGFGR